MTTHSYSPELHWNSELVSSIAKRERQIFPSPSSSSVFETREIRETKDEEGEDKYYRSSKEENNRITFTINSVTKTVPLHKPNELLVEYLRDREKLTGVKLACGEGGCGACTVMVSDDPDGKPYTVNACLVHLSSLEGKTVTTIEDIGTSKAMDEVQRKIAQYNGTQCGYCTPGFVTTMKCYLKNKEDCKKSIQDIEDLFDGHLCRCTGYRPILCGFKTFADDKNKAEMEETPEIAPDDGHMYGSTLKHKNVLEHPKFAPSHSKGVSMMDLDGPQPESRGQQVPLRKSYTFSHPAHTWHQPRNLDQVFDILYEISKDREAEAVKLVVGNTWQGLSFLTTQYRHWVDMTLVRELKYIKRKESRKLEVGASTTIAELINDPSIAAVDWLSSHLKRIGSTQVRNVASVIGNVMLAKEALANTDLALLLDLLNATVTVQSRGSILDVSVRTFIAPAFKLQPTEIVHHVTIPIPDKSDKMASFKVGKRFQNSRAIVSAGFHLQFGGECSVIIGGLKRPSGVEKPSKTAVAVHMKTTEQFWKQVNPNSDPQTLIQGSLQALKTDLEAFDVENEYPMRTAAGFLFKFLLAVTRVGAEASLYDYRVIKNTSQGKQEFAVNLDKGAVSQPIMKNTAYIQATGEAIYTQDIRSIADTHHGVYVLSTHAHSSFAFKAPRIDILNSIKEEFPTVVEFITSAEVERYRLEKGPTCHPDGDTVFANGITIYYGQPIAMVVASLLDHAKWAAEKVKQYVVYHNDKTPAIQLTDSQHYLNEKPRINKVSRGQIPSGFWNKDDLEKKDLVFVEGQQYSPSQYHFYMETQSAIAQPTPSSIVIYASTQSPNTIQGKVAWVLSTDKVTVPMSAVEVRVSQLGGGFGGKEPQSMFVACSAAIAASRIGKPVSVILDRNTDMEMIGKGHAYLGSFKIAAHKKTGKIEAMHIEYNADSGCSYDTTFPVMDLSVLCADNAYNVPNFEVDSKCTALRSFGVMQSTTITEAAMEALAEKLNMDPAEVRFKNFYNQGEKTPYDQVLERCNMKGVWNSLKDRVGYDKRKQEIETFNMNNTWKKKGMAMIPLKYGISFTRLSANQVNATVQVFSSDGSIIITQGGIEMGQGLYTKLQQIAGKELGVSLSLIRVQSYSSHSIVNAPSTGASTGTDLNGGAVQLACRDLVKNMKECFKNYLANKSAVALLDDVKTALSELETRWKNLPADQQDWRDDIGKEDRYWKALVSLAYKTRSNLTGNGHYATKGLSEVINGKGNPFYYFNYAAAYSEVEIDVLTGEHVIHKTSIVYDAGESLNPAIDIGQVEGGFVQGLGNMTSEELVFDKNGKLETNGTWVLVFNISLNTFQEYKIPCSKSIPLQFDVALYPSVFDRDQTGTTSPPPRIALDGQPIPGVAGVQSAKTTGEPPLVLANSVFFAIRNAIRAFRIEQNLPVENWRIDAPATIAQIQKACHSAQGFNKDWPAFLERLVPPNQLPENFTKRKQPTGNSV